MAWASETWNTCYASSKPTVQSMQFSLDDLNCSIKLVYLLLLFQFLKQSASAIPCGWYHDTTVFSASGNYTRCSLLSNICRRWNVVTHFLISFSFRTRYHSDIFAVRFASVNEANMVKGLQSEKTRKTAPKTMLLQLLRCNYNWYPQARVANGLPAALLWFSLLLPWSSLSALLSQEASWDLSSAHVSSQLLFL